MEKLIPLLALPLVLAACGDDTTTAGPDMAPTPYDGTFVPDLAVPPDLTPGPDLATPPDLTPPADLYEPTCSDGAKNGNETDVDCGGACAPCGDGKLCSAAFDCTSGVCGGGKCAVAACDDKVKNGDEVDVDCGGKCTAKCADGKACKAGTDCATGVCAMGVCAAASCTDGAKNGDETDADCGGKCPKCGDGKACAKADDCGSLVCTGGKCAAATCDDKVKNGSEGDVDCGGACATKCVDGKACALDGDCASSVCNGGKCAVPACDDKVKNGDETDADCGGAKCTAKCGDGKGCAKAEDCQSKVCTASKCAAPACDDKVQNGDETGVDCGGAKCAACDLASGGAANPNTSPTPAGFQVRVDITAFADKGFFSVQAKAGEQKYCFEQTNGECLATPSSKAIWVKLTDPIPAGGSVDLRFAVEKAAKAVDGKDVFDLYDDFADGDIIGWAKEGATIDFRTVDGEKGMHMNPTGGSMYAGNDVYLTTPGMGTSYTVEGHIKDIENAGYNYPGGLIIVFQDANNWLGLEGQIGAAWTERGENGGGDTNWIHNWSPNVFKNGWQTHRVDVLADGTYKLWLDGKMEASKPIPAPFPNLAHNGVGIAKHASTGTMFLNWIRLRKYADMPVNVTLK